MTVGLLLLTFVIAMAVEDLGIILELIGATGRYVRRHTGLHRSTLGSPDIWGMSPCWRASLPLCAHPFYLLTLALSPTFRPPDPCVPLCRH